MQKPQERKTATDASHSIFAGKALSKQIWLGPLLGSNRSRLVEMCAARVSQNKSHSFLYLAASHPLLELVTEQIVTRTPNQGVWGELPVYLFRGLVRRLIATAVNRETLKPLTARTAIDTDELPLKRSLISQILKRLSTEGRLSALRPLANQDGCVNTIVSLIGEIQRAGKSPVELNEIVEARIAECGPSDAGRVLHLQIDFDREVALIYERYRELLEGNKLTEDDANGLRALGILRGELDGEAVYLPWLTETELLVLDGFFDFTPVQGEILRLLIPQFPQVIVNLNRDDRNPDIFKPFDETIERLSAISDFDVQYNPDEQPAKGALTSLRTNLFKSVPQPGETTELETEGAQGEISYVECSDRETEIRAIAKEIKRLVLADGYRLLEIALVVRERAVYAETISRVMREESLPLNLDRSIAASEIPATRAVLKLLGLLDELTSEDASTLRMPPLADQIKSGYLRLSRESLESLAAEFETKYSHLLSEYELQSTKDRLRREWGIGRWDPDAIENAIAYVGGELRLTDWLERCRRLIEQLPGAAETRELLNLENSDGSTDDDEAQLNDAETVQREDLNLEKKRKPADLHPAFIAWAALVVKGFASILQSAPNEGEPEELRAGIMSVLEQLQFRQQVNRPIRRTQEGELPRATLDLQALEALRRSFATAMRSIRLVADDGAITKTSIHNFIGEVRRGLSAQNIAIGTSERAGLRVLEATDVRGLRFRAIFIAGLTEGGFPLNASRDWIYPHEERERLKRHGLSLEDISPATLLKEEHYFYQAACRATERLYLSRPLVIGGDNESVASYYVDELRRAIAPFAVRKGEVLRPDYDGKQLDSVSSARELAIGLVRQQQKHLLGLDHTSLVPYNKISSLLTLARNDLFVTNSALHRITIERERAGERFGPYDGRIDQPDLLKMLGRRFGPDYEHSASGLSTFGNCPYRFFAQRVLKLQPRGEAALDLQALDAGKLLHDILRRFFERHRGERLDPVKRDALTTELLAIADEVFDKHQRVVPPLNRQIWQLDREIRKIILRQVLQFELDIQEKSSGMGVRPAHFELAFGGTRSSARDPASVETPLQLTRSTLIGEESMNINGQIDRVDVGSNETVVAYDYKLSKGATKRDILAGRSLQIPIYLEALEQLFFPKHTLAGGGYYTLRGGSNRRNTGMYRMQFKEALGLQAKNSVLSEDEWQQVRADVTARIWNFLDLMRSGSFTVEPSQGITTCKFCDYRAVCRYDKYRIASKRRPGATHDEEVDQTADDE